MIVYYGESILTYIASIRSYYGLSSSYPSNEKLDALLRQKAPEKIFLLLVDGMGSRLLEQKLEEDAFLRRHMTYKTVSVFPPTTTAATTSILTGKSPNETNWLGWMQYVREVDDIIVPFQGKSYYSHRQYDPSLMYQLYPVKPIAEELREKGVKAKEVYPAFREGGCASFHEVCERLKELDKSDVSFVYAYYDEYDTIMHQYSPSGKQSDEYLLYVNGEIEELSKALDEKTMLIVTADHGQIDIEKVFNLKNGPLDKYLRRPPAIEQRALAFYVKEGCLEDFERDFKELYEDEFILLSQKQVLETKLFGEGENHPRLNEMIGDYLAIAKGKAVFLYQDDPSTFTHKGQHAGCHIDELEIPVITFMKG
ncbi:MAG: alkaline phosphatase family protein [Erysipelotrichaceae bacterium]|nr:alkaline phosphatase family protein [Erysipelotrichaceae bacterium]